MPEHTIRQGATVKEQTHLHESKRLHEELTIHPVSMSDNYNWQPAVFGIMKKGRRCTRQTGKKNSIRGQSKGTLLDLEYK